MSKPHKCEHNVAGCGEDHAAPRARAVVRVVSSLYACISPSRDPRFVRVSLVWHDREEENAGQTLEIVSISQIVRLLDRSPASQERLRAWGVCVCDASFNEVSSRRRDGERASKQLRTEMTVNRPKATSYTSTSVWITGFIRLEQHMAGKRESFRICLCDTSRSIAAHLIEPSLDLVDTLVLVKTWTIVETRATDSRRHSIAIEVGSDYMVLQRPSTGYMSIDSVRGILHANFPTRDPPMYIGVTYWDGSESIASSNQHSAEKRKVHVAFGRISAVSPIAGQEDPVSAHCFVEVEQDDRIGPVQSVVNVLVSGIEAMRIHTFLSPGQHILMTNLKKVYNPENGMFLLQASVSQPRTPRCSSIVSWKASDPYPSSSSTTLLEAGSSSVIDVQSIVTSVVWDDCLVLDGDPVIYVSLFQYPWVELKQMIRRGCRLRIRQAHVLQLPTAAHPRLLLGLCVRSHVAVADFGPCDGQFLVANTTNRQRLQRKLDCFGSFSRQPLAVTMWWLGLFELIARKFRFGSDGANEHDSASFSKIRRREATLAIGQDLFGAMVSAKYPSSTLAHQFLRSHEEGEQDCPSTSAPSWGAKTTIANQDLVACIHALTAEKRDAVVWPLIINSDELPDACPIGVIQGNVDSSDLSITDATGSIPLVLNRSGPNPTLSIDGGFGLYALRKYSAMVELIHSDPSRSTAATPAFQVSLVVSLSDLQRISLCADPRRIDAVQPDSLFVFITHIGPWKRRPQMRHGVHEFRHVRGVGFHARRTWATAPDLSSAHQVELLVGVEVETWYLERYSWCRFVPDEARTEFLTHGRDAALLNWFVMVAEIASSPGGKVRADDDQVEELWQQALQRSGQVTTITHVLQKRALVVPVLFSCSSKSTREECTQLVASAMEITSSQTTVKLAQLLETYARKLIDRVQVRDLFDFTTSPSGTAATGVNAAIRSDPHSSRLVTLIGVVSERHISMRPAKHGDRLTRVCRFKLRDLESLDSVWITVDEEAFGTRSALQPQTVIELSLVQCFVARASFKAYLTWTHCTTARSVMDAVPTPLSDGQIMARMGTTYIFDLYECASIDRSIKRLVVRVVHTSYVVLKKKCRLCKQPVSLLKRQRTWMHTSDLASDLNGQPDAARQCSWKITIHDSPLLDERTYTSCSMRCVIDDGSGQAELFLEGDVVWELLRCSIAQRRHFEELLSRHTADLTFYPTKAPGDVLFSSATTQDALYYQNEWRAFVLSAMANRGAVVLIAQRFYQQSKSAPHTVVLKFGKDIQVTTTSAPLVQLEAIRVDEVNPRHELRRRLERANVTSH